VNIVIDGGKGFIGSHLFQYLKDAGHEVAALDNLMHPCANPIPSEYCDVRYINDLEPYFKNADIVFHLAAQINVDKSISNPDETIGINVLGTQNVLELARKYNVKVIFASTSEIYGTSQSDKISESHQLDCQSPYGASKVCGDRMCYAYYKTYGTNVVVVRNFNTFGKYQNDDSYGGVISKFTKAALKDEPLCIFGDGTQSRDYMDIKDAIQAYVLSIDLPAGSIVNFGTGKTVTINDLAKTIKQITNSKSEIKHISPRLGEVQRLCADITLAKSLGFEPKTNFEEDLKEYVLWKRNS